MGGPQTHPWGRALAQAKTGGAWVLRLLLLVCVVFSSGTSWGASVDDESRFQDESERPLAPLPPPSGLAQMGHSGLVTIPTPGPAGRQRFRVAWKSVPTLGEDFTLGSSTYRSELESTSGHLVMSFPEYGELAITRFQARRTSSPALPALDGDDSFPAFGIRLNDDPENPNWALGCQYAAFSRDQASRLDADQLTQARVLYVTTGCTLTGRLSGFLHFKTCFLPDQEWALPSGEVQHKSRNNLNVYGLGGEWRTGRGGDLALFGEVIALDYRGLLPKNEPHWQGSMGLRLTRRTITLEILGRSLESAPTLAWGVEGGF